MDRYSKYFIEYSRRCRVGNPFLRFYAVEWDDIFSKFSNIPSIQPRIPEDFNHCQWIYAVPSNSVEYQLIRLLNTDIPVPDEALGAFGLPNSYTLEWLSDLFSVIFKMIRAILTAHSQGVHVGALHITGDNGLLAHIVELLNVSVGDIH